ncbi:hypothetical protein AMECASPLE_038075 [Ameca splendens]|uniref:Uncharacterized protein n=1 Tax=Ameca splendens TaxID=208324 RepID=A0ABV0Y853_9TELE
MALLRLFPAEKISWTRWLTLSFICFGTSCKSVLLNNGGDRPECQGASAVLQSLNLPQHTGSAHLCGEFPLFTTGRRHGT